MRHTFRKTFPHRRNPDGTFDSFCIRCFATVATESTETELHPAEIAHACKGFSLGPILHGTEREARAKRSRQSTPQASQGV